VTCLVVSAESAGGRLVTMAKSQAASLLGSELPSRTHARFTASVRRRRLRDQVLIFFAVGLLAVTILAHKYQQKYYVHGNAIVPGLPIYFIRSVTSFTSKILRTVRVFGWADMMFFCSK
jgi:hypothetical protein